MATRQSQKIEPPKVIGAISKFAGVLVGTAVVTGKRIVKTAAQAGEEPSPKPRKKKKAAVKTKAKGRKLKKKVAKKKNTGPRRKSKGPGKGPAQSPAKKLKAPD